ncbi:Uncharacterised protein (plasmid) [Legionella adelaidensis]|uniref:Uncharacterized protein n=1 Tax=Legionella adelaidensis TaxID=45056 RepID=A0A0W0R3D7_9GAMM|nr:hypothetical protein [Legionella adelaidensis]KTC65590.1 hypothetical protein Lade_0248 [Legionella adelaidensis]VEH85213.1 Uncharacterised protein [Legionella adelaidensis]
MKLRMLLLIVSLGFGVSLTANADSSSEKETTATFKTQDGKTIRCMIHPNDKVNFYQIKQGENVKLLILPDELELGADMKGSMY